MTEPITATPAAPASPSLTQWVACEECDAIYQRKPLQPAERAYCLCCGAALYRDNNPLKTLLPLVTTALITLIIANIFPIVTIELQGLSNHTTLLGAVWVMLDAEHGLVGLTMLLTTFLLPLIDILLLLYVLVPIVLWQHKPRYLVNALNLIAHLRHWIMVEVFLIGVLVTLVKLSAMVIVVPGVALWAFAVSSILQIWIGTFTVANIWHDIERRQLS